MNVASVQAYRTIAALLASLLVSQNLGAEPESAAESGSNPTAPGKGGNQDPTEPAAIRPLSETLTGEAKGEYGAGRRLHRNGDYAAARAKFQRAYELTGDARLLVNMVLCDDDLGHYARALALAQRSLREGADLLTKTQRQKMIDFVRAAEAHVSRLWVQSTEAGSAVLVDGTEVDTAPMQKPVRVDPGRHVIQVTKAGFSATQCQVERSGTEVKAAFKPAGCELELPSPGVAVTVKVHMQREQRVEPTGKLEVIAAPGQSIRLDGKARGRGRWQGAVRWGRHQLQVTGPDRQAYLGELTLQAHKPCRLVTARGYRGKVARDPGKPCVFRIKLKPRPALPQQQAESSTPWLLIAGGGATLVAGAVVGGYLLFRSEEEPPPRSPPSVERGTLDEIELP